MTKKIDDATVEDIRVEFPEHVTPPALGRMKDDVYKRGFVESVVDLGNDPTDPDPTTVLALAGMMVEGVLDGYTVLSKQRTPGYYAHCLWSSETRFEKLRKRFKYEESLKVDSFAFEDWPDYALNADGERNHVFFGVQDPEERR